ncbi:MAG: hypothetical protein WCL50_06725 [Spirochaetota bacterium]
MARLSRPGDTAAKARSGSVHGTGAALFRGPSSSSALALLDDSLYDITRAA